MAEAIRRQLDRMTERYEVTVDKIVDELAKLGFSNIGNYLRRDAQGRVTNVVDLSQCTPDELAAVESIQYEEDVVVKGTEETGTEEMAITTRKVKFKLHDKKSALVDLLKQLGGQFKSKDDNSGDGKVIIEGGLPDPDPVLGDKP